MPMTHEEIDVARTPNGGWTKAQLSKWGVPWPPPKGWKRALVDNGPMPMNTPAFILDHRGEGMMGITGRGFSAASVSVHGAPHGLINRCECAQRGE